MKNLTWQNPEQLFVAQELINKVKSKCCGIKENKKNVRVRVVRKGPLFGMEGQFVRYGGRHYIAIQVSGSAALLKVSYTWCELIEEI